MVVLRLETRSGDLRRRDSGPGRRDRPSARAGSPQRSGERRHISGIGLGILASGTVVPVLLLDFGLRAAWLGLAAFAAALTALT